MRPSVKTALLFVDLAPVIDNSSFNTPHRLAAETERGVVTSRNAPMPW